MKYVAATCSTLTLMAACATKVAETTPSSFSTVGPNLVVRDLGPDDLGRLCLDVQVFGATALTDDDLARFACTADAIKDGITGGNAPRFCHECLSSCFDRAPSCTTTYPLTRQPIDFGSCRDFYQGAVGCSLTVGEVGDCLMAIAAADHGLAQLDVSVCDDMGPDAGGGTFAVGPSNPGATAAECTSRCGVLVSYARALIEGGGTP